MLLHSGSTLSAMESLCMQHLWRELSCLALCPPLSWALEGILDNEG